MVSILLLSVEKPMYRQVRLFCNAVLIAFQQVFLDVTPDYVMDRVYILLAI